MECKTHRGPHAPGRKGSKVRKGIKESRKKKKKAENEALLDPCQNN